MCVYLSGEGGGLLFVTPHFFLLLTGQMKGRDLFHVEVHACLPRPAIGRPVLHNPLIRYVFTSAIPASCFNCIRLQCNSYTLFYFFFKHNTSYIY